MNRRELLLRAAAGGTGALVLGNTGWRPEPARAAAGCLWGVHVEPRGSLSGEVTMTNLETALGRKFAVDRRYHTWDDALPSDQELWTNSQGRIAYVSWHAFTSTGACMSWADIAAGKQDTWIGQQAAAIAAWGQPMYFCFHHEPEDDLGCGNAAGFKAAHERIRGIFDAAGATNLTWVVTLMASTFRGGHGGPAAWMPSRYDIVGVDGYNRYPCRAVPYRAFSDLFLGARAFAIAQGKPLAIGEYGCVEQNACGNASGDPLGKAKWFTAAGATLKTWPEVVFASYSHVFAFGAYWIDTSSASESAFRTVGLDPYFGGPGGV